MIKGADRLIDEADILDVAVKLGMEVHRKGRNYFCLCPNPQHADHNPDNCFFREGDNYMYCTVCNKGYNAIHLIQFKYGNKFPEAVRMLWEFSGCPGYVDFKDGKNKDEKKTVSLPVTYKNMQFLGIKLPGFIEEPCGQDEWRKKEENYYQKSLDYVRIKRTRAAWEDFISPEDMAYMMLEKAKKIHENTIKAQKTIEDSYLRKKLEEDYNMAFSIIIECKKFLRMSSPA